MKPGDLLMTTGWTDNIAVWPTRDVASRNQPATRFPNNVKNRANGTPIMVLEVYPLMVSGGRKLLAIMTGQTIGWIALTNQTLAELSVIAHA